MPIKGLEYEINEWDGLAKGVAPTRVVRAAPTAIPAPAPVPAAKPTQQTAQEVTAPSKHPELQAWAKDHPQEARQFLGEVLALALYKANKDPLYPLRKFIIMTKWKLIGIPVPQEIETALQGFGQTYKTNQWDGTISDLERGR